MGDPSAFRTLPSNVDAVTERGSIESIRAPPPTANEVAAPSAFTRFPSRWLARIAAVAPSTYRPPPPAVASPPDDRATAPFELTLEWVTVTAPEKTPPPTPMALAGSEAKATLCSTDE